MKYPSVFKLYLDSQVPLPLEFGLNGQQDLVMLDNSLVYSVDIPAETDYVLTIEQQANTLEQFFYIRRVVLGNLDVTELLHHFGICQVTSKSTNELFGQFIEDIGSNDRVTIKIDNYFYVNIIKMLHIVKEAVDQ